MIYFVRGTLAIKLDASAGTSTLKIEVILGAGFVTPEVAPRAIVLPVPHPTPGRDPSAFARLIPLTKNRFECDATAFVDNLAGLIAIAAQQKLIEIRIKPQTPSSTSPAWKLVGFTFPVS